LYTEDEPAEIEGNGVEICLRAGVFERLDEVGCVWGEGYSCEEGDYCAAG
jgi:hypothetical protein